MRLLLDTHAFLWCVVRWDHLDGRCRRRDRDPANEVFVSAVSGWEIGVKRAKGRLTAPDNLASMVEDRRFRHLPLTFRHAERAAELPMPTAIPSTGCWSRRRRPRDWCWSRATPACLSTAWTRCPPEAGGYGGRGEHPRTCSGSTTPPPPESRSCPLSHPPPHAARDPTHPRLRGMRPSRRPAGRPALDRPDQRSVPTGPSRSATGSRSSSPGMSRASTSSAVPPPACSSSSRRWRAPRPSSAPAGAGLRTRRRPSRRGRRFSVTLAREGLLGPAGGHRRLPVRLRGRGPAASRSTWARARRGLRGTRTNSFVTGEVVDRRLRGSPATSRTFSSAEQAGTRTWRSGGDHEEDGMHPPTSPCRAWTGRTEDQDVVRLRMERQEHRGRLAGNAGM